MRDLTQYPKPGLLDGMNMLEMSVGNMTVKEDGTHFTHYRPFKFPLIMGAAMHNVTKEQIDIMRYKEVMRLRI